MYEPDVGKQSIKQKFDRMNRIYRMGKDAGIGNEL
jgi:hypothetical protein